MLGNHKIEDLILKSYKNIVAIVLPIILIVYIFNVKNHYKLFFEQIKKLENDVKSCKYDYQIATRLIRKILDSSNFIGSNLLNLSKLKNQNHYKIVLISFDHKNTSTFNNLIKIIHRIKRDTQSIKILDFSYKNKEKMKSFNQYRREKLSISKPTILLVDSRNYVLVALPIDGMESPKELQLITEYLLRVIRKKIK